MKSVRIQYKGQHANFDRLTEIRLGIAALAEQVEEVVSCYRGKAKLPSELIEAKNTLSKADSQLVELHTEFLKGLAGQVMRRSNADKRNAVVMALELDAMLGRNRSDRAIARYVGVHWSTVGEIRQEWQSGSSKARSPITGKARQHRARKEKSRVRETIVRYVTHR